MLPKPIKTVQFVVNKPRYQTKRPKDSFHRLRPGNFDTSRNGDQLRKKVFGIIVEVNQTQ